MDAKRTFDIVLASVGLAAAAPVVGLAALALTVESPGPVFFAQPRLGRGGRPFRLYKLRKFQADADADGPALTVALDPRLTRVGALLERSRLDELPQLWNVLRGEMSLVGPRPESLYFEDLFAGPAAALLAHRPGLFGPAQCIALDEAGEYPPGENPEVFYRRVLFPRKAAIDLGYYPSATPLRDVAWIGACVFAVLASLGRAPAAARAGR